MFNGGMATRQNEIELPDVEPAAFLATLRFLYTDEVGFRDMTALLTDLFSLSSLCHCSSLNDGLN